jgi:hypothetical protein
VVTNKATYLYGTPRLGVQPQGSVSGKPHEAIFLDVPQAELLEKNTVSRDGTIVQKNTNLGDACKDIISGFSGICTGICEYLYSCTRVLLAPRECRKDSGNLKEAVWFDEPQVETTKGDAIKRNTSPGKIPSGGFKDPIPHGQTAGQDPKKDDLR